MKISLLCPTRGRPDWMERFAMSLIDTAFDVENIEIIFFVDDDDENSLEMADYIDNYVETHTVIRPPKTVNLTDMYNKCWEAATGEIFAPINDDFMFESHGWDRYIREAFEAIPDKIALVYGNSIEGIKVKTAKVVLGFIHKNWTDTVGRMSPPYFMFHHADIWVRRIAEELDRKIYLPTVDIIHYHCAKYGKISAEQRSNVTRKENAAIWNKHKHEIGEEAAKLQKFIDGYAN
jgi:glycosyltransferase involved in cell wall biosynthesis